MPAREGYGTELAQGRPYPSRDCSVRSFAGANYPHRTPLKSVFYDCGEYGWENQSGANNVTFFQPGRFSQRSSGAFC